MSVRLQVPLLKEIKPLIIRRSGKKRLSISGGATSRTKSRSCSPRFPRNSHKYHHRKSPRSRPKQRNTLGQALATPFRGPISRNLSPSEAGRWLSVSPVEGEGARGHGRPLKYVVSPGYNLQSNKIEYSISPNHGDNNHLKVPDRFDIISSITPPVSSNPRRFTSPRRTPNDYGIGNLFENGRNVNRCKPISPIPFVFTNDEDEETTNRSDTSRFEGRLKEFLDEIAATGTKSCNKFNKNVKVLGKGTFGQVVFGKLKDMRVAVKVTVAPKCRHIGEINAKHLMHPNVVRTLDVYNYPTRSLVLMEYGGEKNLQQILDDPEESIPRTRRNS